MRWFEIDKHGLAKLLERKGKAFAIFELVQNAWDEKTTQVEISVSRVPSSPYVELVVEDDNPDGFADLTHAFTLFADSSKKGDAEKRGRFNLGEKLVLALCSEAEISSTTGTVVFDATGRLRIARKREVGSRFRGLLRMTATEVEECYASAMRLLPPAGISTTYNGVTLEPRAPAAVFELSLPTEIADAEGVLRRTVRRTSVRVFEPHPGEPAMLYEMGIPVVETGDRWHLDIAQKVPVNFDRDNVPPAYLSRLRAEVVEIMAARLSVEDANSTWVRDAIQGHGEALSAAAIDRVAELRFGKKRVAFDPSDLEANHIAVAMGYQLVYGAQLSKAEWDAVKRTDAILPAGKVTPSPKAYHFAIDGDPINFIDPAAWTPGMRAVADYTARIARHVLGQEVSVRMVNEFTKSWGGCYGNRELHFNIARLGKAWFAADNREQINDLVVHELAHEHSSNHLSADFHRAICRIAAKLVELALVNPDALRIA